jgi:hypothetical protein
VKLVFYVTDAVGFAGKIKAAGLEITHPPTPNAGMGGAVICLAKDPDGYVIELIERPARSAVAEDRASASA